MPAVKYNYIEEQLQELPQKAKYKSLPIHGKNQKVRRAPKTAQEKLAVLNAVLVTMGAVVAIGFTIVYSLVALSETKLAQLHSEISDLNYENTDLENKLENIKSYYSVDTKVSSSALFDKAKNVIEVEQVDAKAIEHQTPRGTNLNTVTGF